MYINNINPYKTNNTSFKQQPLQQAEVELATAFIRDYATSGAITSRDKFLNLMLKPIEKIAETKSKSGLYLDKDLFQDFCEYAIKCIEEIKDMFNPVDIFFERLKNYKPEKDAKNPQYKRGEVSLNKTIYGDNLTIGDTISNEQTLTPISQPNEEERKIAKEKLENKLKNIENLTENEKNLIRLRAEGKLYSEIAKLYNLSKTNIRLKILVAIAKIQDGHNILPQDYEEKAQEFIEILGLKQDIKTIKQWLIMHPEILPKDVTQLKKNLLQLSQYCAISYDKMLTYAMNDISLFITSHKTVEQNAQKVITSFEKDGLTKKDYVYTILDQKALSSYSSDKIIEHINAYMYVAKNNHKKNDIHNILCKSLTDTTSLIYLKNIILPQLKKQDQEFSKWKDANLKSKFQTYFIEHPDKQFTIKLIEDKITNSCIKTIKEFCQETFGRDNMFKFTKYTEKDLKKEKEVKQQKLEDKLAKSNLSEKEKDIIRSRENGTLQREIAQRYNLSVITFQIQLGIAMGKLQSMEDKLPPRYEKKAQEFIEILGLKQNIEAIKKWLLGHPRVLPKDTNMLKENILELSRNLNVDYNTLLTYAMKDDILFRIPHKTIEKNVQDVVTLFEKDGLTKKNYIDTLLKDKSLFLYSPEKIAEHIKAYIYVAKNNSKNNSNKYDINQIVLHKKLLNSTPLIYLKGIILTQLKKQNKEFLQWKKTNLKSKFETYFIEHPDKQFTIKLIEDKITNSCIKTIKEFCQETFGRDNMFKFTKYTEEDLKKENEDKLQKLEDKLAKYNLSEREKKILRYYAEGITNYEIAKLCGISKSRVSRILIELKTKIQDI